jgi:hypothetical protein
LNSGELQEIRAPPVLAMRAKLILSLAGVLFLLLTYVIRDVYREHLKELSDSISQAEQTFLILQGESRNYSELQKIEERMTVIQQAQAKNPGEAKALEKALASVDDWSFLDRS